eukprot:TCONS_00025983-protein
MKQDLETGNWQTIFLDAANDKSVEELWQVFKNKVSKLQNRFIPLKTIGGEGWRKRGRIPIPKHLRTEIAKKKRLHRKGMKSSPREKDENRVKYTRVRNRVTKMMTQAHRNYE